MPQLVAPTRDPPDPAADGARVPARQGEAAPNSRPGCPTGDACIICNEPPGPGAPEQQNHESRILARVAGIEGVAQPAAITRQVGADVPLNQALRTAPLDVPAQLALALTLAQILAAVHRRGVLHRNINPGSIVLTGPQRSPVLAGFHLATTLAEGHPGFIHHRDAGARPYLAPEQTGRTGRSVDQRTDLYGLGSTLYEVATGRPPFEDRDPLQLIHDQLATLPASPAVLAPGLPPMLCEIILRLLKKERSQRYQSAEGLAHDLTRLRDSLARGDCAAFELGQRDFPLRLSPPSRLVGRETETDMLRLAFEEAVQGASRVVLLAGASGVGKTSLIQALRPIVAAQRGWFVYGKFDQYRQDAPSATMQALRALGRLLLAEPAAELGRDRDRIRAALGPHAGRVAGPGLPEFVTLLGKQPAVPPGDPAGAELTLLLTTLKLLRAVVSPVRPLVMVLDDLQWARPLSVRFIEHVLTGQDVPGLLVVAAYRPEELGVTHPLSAVLQRWQHLKRPPVLLPLSNLPPADLAAMLEEMLRLQPEPATALAQAVGAHTGGNPYDTVELVNTLRREGALVPGPQGWDWDAGAIRRFIGRANVVDLLATRIARLPPQGRALLEAVACLGGEVRLALLQAATNLPATVLELQLAAPLEDGLLELAGGDDSAVRLPHDRVQQAAYGALDPAQRSALHLAFARRLACAPDCAMAAAEQYMPVVAQLVQPDERRCAAGLFRAAAGRARGAGNSATEERFLAAAISLRDGMDSAADAPLFAALEIEHHAALYKLGRLVEADSVYRAIEARRPDALVLVGATCVQVASLSNRGRRQEAVALGMPLLLQLGLQVPDPIAASDIDQQIEVLQRWVREFSHAHDLARPEASDPRVVAAAKLINQLQAPAFFCDLMLVAWLVLESRRLWDEHGPCAALVATLSRVTLVSIALRHDYRTGYDAIRLVLDASEARGYQPETSQARHLFAISTCHWFEPLENGVAQARQAREGLLLGGDLQNACFTYRASIAGLLDCGPTLDSYAAEIEAGLALAERTGNAHATSVNLADRQLLRCLRGQTGGWGSFCGEGFDEAAHLDSVVDNPMALVSFHIRRALAAALFADPQQLQHHAAAALPLLRFIQGFYPTALAHLLQALALAQRVKAAAPHERDAVLAQFDASRDWMVARAADAPFNFLHLLRLVEAERAWAMDDFEQAARLFDAALRAVQPRQRPWHWALITERAGLFHLARGMECTGQMLLAQALELYRAWGASAKVEQLQRCHGFLDPARDAPCEPGPGRGDRTSIDTIDMLAILRVSQALSSETSLARLQAKVVELLGALTGATTVRFALWHEDAKDWFLPATADEAPIPVEQAASRGLLPLSAFRYAQRTHQPLLVEDAAQDDRFASDPYLAGLHHCSLLVVPILNQGAARAILLLENRLSLGAFSTDRLDAVTLIAGQLAVSLENALLYDRLEQRVRDQTRELLATARRAGMAQIATNVLHNVGNVLNSVNTSAHMLRNQVTQSRTVRLADLAQLLESNAADLANFFATDTGRLVPNYVRDLAHALASEREQLLGELQRMDASVEHIKNVVAMQQSYAGAGALLEPVAMATLVDDTLRLQEAALARHGVTVVRNYASVERLTLDRTRVMQILVNLVENACHAMGRVAGQRILGVTVRQEEGWALVEVSDNGCGITEGNLGRVFAHGFTTKAGGHGFGLHSCAVAAMEMGGTLGVHSEGVGAGAMFTLRLPMSPAAGSN